MLGCLARAVSSTQEAAQIIKETQENQIETALDLILDLIH